MPKRNFGTSFLGGFQQTFNPTFQNVLHHLQRKQMVDEAEEKERVRQEEGQKAVMDLIRGGETAKTPTGEDLTINKLIGRPKSINDFKGYDFETQEQGFVKPYTQQEKLKKIAQIFPEPSQYYNAVSKLLTPEAPKKQPLVYVGGGIKGYKLNPKTNQLEVDAENWIIPPPTKEPKKEKVWIADERMGDKMNKLMGHEDPDADPKDSRTRIVNGKKYTVTDHSTFDIWEKRTTDVGDPFDLSDATKKTLKDYFTRQQELRAITNAGFGNREDPKTKKPYKESLTEFNKVYLEGVRNAMPKSAEKWYDDLYNAGGDEIDPRDYLLNLMSSYAEGKLGKDPKAKDNYELADFNILLEQFKAIYGFDPVEQYGTNLERLE